MGKIVFSDGFDEIRAEKPTERTSLKFLIMLGGGGLRGGWAPIYLFADLEGTSVDYKGKEAVARDFKS